MKKLLFHVLLFFALFFKANAQDIHFTQWFFAPHTYNPAEVGNFNGQHRFHANHRNQWSSVTVPFQTFAFMADSKALTKNENLGIGTNIVHDVTGDSKFATTSISASASYQFNFLSDSSGKSKGNLSFGVQPSFTQKKIDLTKLFFDNQFNGNYFDPSLSTNENLPRLSRWYFDVAVGARLFVSLNEKQSIEAGISGYNLLRPKQSFFNQDQIQLDSRINTYFKFNHSISEKLMFQPGILFSNQGTFTSLNIGGQLFYDLSESEYFTKKVFVGLYGRALDSGDLLAGLLYNSWTFGVSYDFNFSSLVPASNYKGGLELALIYLIKNAPKRPAYKSCPPYL